MAGCWVCGSTDTRLYLVGPACAAHTPARMAGRDELTPDPEWGIVAGYRRSGWRYSFNRNDTALKDTQAVARGQRVSGARRKAQHQADVSDQR